MVTVVMDGVAGYGPSFLEEAFGGLVRKEGFDKQSLESRLKLVTARSNREKLVRDAIANASPESMDTP